MDDEGCGADSGFRECARFLYWSVYTVLLWPKEMVKTLAFGFPVQAIYTLVVRDLVLTGTSFAWGLFLANVVFMGPVRYYPQYADWTYMVLVAMTSDLVGTCLFAIRNFNGTESTMEPGQGSCTYNMLQKTRTLTPGGSLGLLVGLTTAYPAMAEHATFGDFFFDGDPNFVDWWLTVLIWSGIWFIMGYLGAKANQKVVYCGVDSDEM